MKNLSPFYDYPQDHIWNAFFEANPNCNRSMCIAELWAKSQEKPEPKLKKVWISQGHTRNTRGIPDIPALVHPEYPLKPTR